MAFLTPEERSDRGRSAPCLVAGREDGEAGGTGRSEPFRAELRERLEARRSEIEREALARANAISDSAPVPDSAYLQGLRSTVGAALDYALEVIESGGEAPVPLPRQLLAQARSAARRGVPLNTVLRRYVAGYTLLGDHLARESERGGPDMTLA
jgi:hypothetical protein